MSATELLPNETAEPGRSWFGEAIGVFPEQVCQLVDQPEPHLGHGLPVQLPGAEVDVPAGVRGETPQVGGGLVGFRVLLDDHRVQCEQRVGQVGNLMRGPHPGGRPLLPECDREYR